MWKEIMVTSENFEMDITIVAGEGTTLRELENFRLNLFNDLSLGLSSDHVDIYQESASRSVDPAIIGTITLVLLPILIDKVIDRVIEWAREYRVDFSFTARKPAKGSYSINIKYNPQMSPDKLKDLINLYLNQ